MAERSPSSLVVGQVIESLDQRYPELAGIAEKSIIGFAKDDQDPRWNIAWSWLNDKYFRYAYAMGVRITRDPLTAEDIAQETFISAFKNIDRFCGSSDNSFKAWLVAIAHNKAISFLRGKYRENLSLDERTGNDRVAEDDRTNNNDPRHYAMGIPEKETPHAQVEAEETSAEFRALISRLPPLSGKVIELRFFRDFSLREIANELDKTQPSVKQLEHKGLVRLRTLLALSG